MGDRAQQLKDLKTVLNCVLSESEDDAFEEMHQWLSDGKYRGLSAKQQAWLAEVLERVCPSYENLVSAGKVPRGREVALLVRDKPLKPPGR